MELLKRLMRDEEGQGLVEYALIVGLIALFCVVAITAAGGSIKGIWNKIAEKLDDVNVTPTP